MLGGRRLSDEASLGGEQGDVDGPCPLERLGVNRDVDQRIEPTHRANVACLGPFNAQVLGLAVDALATGALRVDDVVERPRAIQQGTHEPTGFEIDVLDAALALGELLVVATLAGARWEEELTAIALGAEAVGVLELIGRVHAQACRAIGGAVGVAWDGIMAVTVEGDGGNATPMRDRFVDVPVIEGSIGRHLDREPEKRP